MELWVQPLMHNAEKPSVYAGLWWLEMGLRLGVGGEATAWLLWRRLFEKSQKYGYTDTWLCHIVRKVDIEHGTPLAVCMLENNIDTLTA